MTEDGQLISYEVREAKVDGYKAAGIVVTGDAINGFKFTVTNTIVPEEPPKENPPKENPPKTPPTPPTPPKTPSRNVEKAKKVQSTTPSAPPKTGDTADLYIWSILMLAAAMATIVAMRRRKEQD